LKNWTIPNKRLLSREEILNDVGSYSSVIEIVEKFFSALRIKTGIYSGYCQIVAKAVDWEDRSYGNLYQVDVVSIRKYPDHFDNYGWLEEAPLITQREIYDALACFKAVQENRHNRIELALSRLNRAFLRSREEDTILDITIALETLLTHDSQSEITFRLASRVAALCLIKPFKDFSQYEVFDFCKKIYSYRSAVVHGDSKRMNKARIIKHKTEKEIQTISLSIELLRHILSLLIERVEFNNPDEIDKLKFKDR